MTKTKIAVITGATSGIGKVIAHELVKCGYSLIVLGRSEKKMAALKSDLSKKNVHASIKTISCDLSSLKSILEACEQVGAHSAQIDLLILNAGLWNFEFKETIDQIEETLQVNLLAPVVMFQRLIANMPKGEGAKVIFTSSGLHQGTINFSDLEFRKKFSGFKAYRQSKLGILLLTRWLAKQEAFEGLSYYCVHPGMVNTELGRSAGWFSRSIFKLFGKSPSKGAQTHLYLIDRSAEELTSGEYYANSRVTRTTSYSYDMVVAEQLWHAINALTVDK